MKKLKVVIVILILIILLLLGFLTFKSKPMSNFEQKVEEITKISEEDRQKYLNQIVEEGMLNVTYSPNCILKNGELKNFLVVNIENNKHPIRFDIMSKEGEIIYSSKSIDVGYQISSIELNKELEKGTHKLKIRIGYDIEGNVSSEFPLEIEVV